jgi:hypothetical protein
MRELRGPAANTPSIALAIAPHHASTQRTQVGGLTHWPLRWLNQGELRHLLCRASGLGPHSGPMSLDRRLLSETLKNNKKLNLANSSHVYARCRRRCEDRNILYR